MLHVASAGKLYLQIHVAIAFLYDIVCMLQAQVETTDGYSTTTCQTTPLQPRILHSMLKASEKLRSASYDPVLIIVRKYMYMCKATNLWLYYTQNNHYTTNMHLFYK